MLEQVRKIITQISFSLVITILTFVISPILIFSLTRSLTVQEFGAYSLLTATIALTQVLFTSGITQYITTKIPGKSKEEASSTFFHILFIQALLLIIFIILTYIFIGDLFIRYVTFTDYADLVYLSAWIIVIATFLRTIAYYFLAKKQVVLQVIVNFLKDNLWMLMIIMLFLTSSLSIYKVFNVWIISVIVALLIVLFLLKKDISLLHTKNFMKDYKKESINRFLLFTLPLFLYTISSRLLAVADKYIINYFHGKAMVGIYSLSYSLADVVNTFGMTVLIIFYPYIAEQYNNKKDHQTLLNLSLKYGLVLMLPMISVIMALKKEAILILGGLNYLYGQNILLILIVYPLFSLLTYILYQELLLIGHTKKIAYIYTFGAIINIILNILLIPKYDLYGAAFSTLISYVVMYLYLASKRLPQLITSFTNIKFSRLIIIAIVLALITNFLKPTSYPSLLIFLICLGILYIISLFVFDVLDKNEKDIIFKYIRQLKFSPKNIYEAEK